MTLETVRNYDMELVFVDETEVIVIIEEGPGEVLDAGPLEILEIVTEFQLGIDNDPIPEILEMADGAVGPVGPPGPAGVAGPVGPVGPAGLTGPQGIQGPPGGPVGPQGAEGVRGPQGFQGPIGPDGPTGPQGPQGHQGPIGDTGPQGIQGPVGDTGPAGPQGPQGVQGLTGADGPQGPQGVQGATGAGVAGPQGPQGAQGNLGPTGPQGEPGIQGIQGTQGPAGVKGDTGLTGVTGTTGDRGPIGLQGPAGPRGYQGPQGIQGDQGVQGASGVAGVPGARGLDGSDGIGMPTGGLTGQALRKVSNFPYEFEWYTPPSYIAPVTSVNAKTGDVVLTQADLGIPNVQNTSDMDKPISTAVAAALATKLSDNAMFTAKGAIAAGKGLVLNADGTVSQVQTAAPWGVGTPYAPFTAPDTNGADSDYLLVPGTSGLILIRTEEGSYRICQGSGNTVVSCTRGYYYDLLNPESIYTTYIGMLFIGSTGKVLVESRTGGSRKHYLITVDGSMVPGFGAQQTLGSFGTYTYSTSNVQSAWDSVTDRVVLITHDMNGSHGWTVTLGVPSLTGVAFNQAGVFIRTIGGSDSGVGILAAGGGTMLLSIAQGGDYTLYGGTLSATVATIGTGVLLPLTDEPIRSIVYNSVDNKYLVFTTTRVWVATLTGTVVTFGTSAALPANSGGVTLTTTVYDVPRNRVYFFGAASTSAFTAAIISISGTTPVVVLPTVPPALTQANAPTNLGIAPVLDSTQGKLYFFRFRDPVAGVGLSRVLYTFVGTITTTTISYTGFLSFPRPTTAPAITVGGVTTLATGTNVLQLEGRRLLFWTSNAMVIADSMGFGNLVFGTTFVVTDNAGTMPGTLVAEPIYTPSSKRLHCLVRCLVGATYTVRVHVYFLDGLNFYGIHRWMQVLDTGGVVPTINMVYMEDRDEILITYKDVVDSNKTKFLLLYALDFYDSFSFPSSGPVYIASPVLPVVMPIYTHQGKFIYHNNSDVYVLTIPDVGTLTGMTAALWYTKGVGVLIIDFMWDKWREVLYNTNSFVSGGRCYYSDFDGALPTNSRPMTLLDGGVLNIQFYGNEVVSSGKLYRPGVGFWEYDSNSRAWEYTYFGTMAISGMNIGYGIYFPESGEVVMCGTWVGSVYPGGYNYTDESFIGISAAGAADGQSLPVFVNGRIATGLSGLSPGATYRVTDTGDLTLNKRPPIIGSSPYYYGVVGTALTTTTLLIRQKP